MAGLTLAQAEAQLSLWIAASAAVAASQSYTIEGRSLTRANAGEIRQQIEFWDRMCRKLDPSRSRIKYISPEIA